MLNNTQKGHMPWFKNSKPASGNDAGLKISFVQGITGLLHKAEFKPIIIKSQYHIQVFP